MEPLVTIAGAGNWLIESDRIGLRVIEKLQKRYNVELVEVCILGNKALALFDYLHRQELLIVVDACIICNQPGVIHLYEPDFSDDSLNNSWSLHQIGPMETLRIVEKLYSEILPQRIIFILVETEGFTITQELDIYEKIILLIDQQIIDGTKNNLLLRENLFNL